MEKASETATTAAQNDQYHYQNQPATLPCPRCNSSNTKFCYYNNYSLSQPRHFCRACKRYWTRGGTIRNVPVGGGSRKNKRVKKPPCTAVQTAQSSVAAESLVSNPVPNSVDSQLDNSMLFPLPPSLSHAMQMPSQLDSHGIAVGYNNQLQQQLPTVNDNYSVFGPSITASSLGFERSIRDLRNLFSGAGMNWNSENNEGVISEVKTDDLMHKMRSNCIQWQFTPENTSKSAIDPSHQQLWNASGQMLQTRPEMNLSEAQDSSQYRRFHSIQLGYI